jgi:hypothetical protein
LLVPEGVFHSDVVRIEEVKTVVLLKALRGFVPFQQKAVYRQTDSSVLRYLSYEWDEKNNDWSLTAPSHDG